MAGSLLIYSLVLASPPTHCRDRSASQPGDTLQFNQPPDGHREEYCRRNNGMYWLKMRRADSSSGKENKFGTEQRGEEIEWRNFCKRKKSKVRRPRIIWWSEIKDRMTTARREGRSEGGRAVPSSVFCPGCSFIVIPDDHSQQCCSSARSRKHPSHQSPSILSLVSLSLLQPRAPHLCPAAAGDRASVHPCCSFTRQDESP